MQAIDMSVWPTGDSLLLVGPGEAIRSCPGTTVYDC